MTDVPLGVSAYHRFDARAPNILVKNLYVEKDPANPVSQLAHIMRPALQPFAQVGTGPIRGIFKQDGVFGNNQYLVVSGTKLYKVGESGNVVLLGNVLGSEYVSIAASTTRAIVASGNTAWTTGGSTVTQVDMPNSVEVSSVAYMNGYFLLTETNSHRIWYISPGNDAPGGLDFFSAENNSDNNLAVVHIGDELWVFKQTSIEIFSPTGDLNAPFIRQEGRLYDKGCANRNTITKTDNTLFWIGSDKIVYRASVEPQRISDFGIEEKLLKTDNSVLRAWSFPWNGHVFYCLTIGDLGTFAYDVSAGGWVEFGTYGRNIWQAHLGAWTDGSLIVAGDSWTNDLWQLSSTHYQDANMTPIVREVVGGIPITGQPQKCHSFSVFCVAGWANLGIGAASIQMRMSDDGGNIWGTWRNASLGKRGNFGFGADWRRLGMVKRPGRLFHVRCTDPSPFRISYARMNEAFAS